MSETVSGVPELVRDGDLLRVVNLDRTGAVSLTWGTDPDAIDTPVDAWKVDDGVVTFDDPSAPGIRPYVRVTSDTGESVVAGERRLPLDGAQNTRDLGGYRAADGRSVRWGRIYRSGALNQLTDPDLAYLERLGISLIVDLRRPGERNDMPSRVTDSMEVVSIPIGDTGKPERSLVTEIREGRVRQLGAPGDALVKANAAFVEVHGDEIRQVVTHLARAVDHPVLVHCTAGKDRAGFSSAIMLLALGVPEEVVVYDYLRTNDFLAARVGALLAKRVDDGMSAEEVDIIRALMEVRPEYLGTALEAMNAKYGSAAAYLRDALGLDDPATERLRSHLLQ